MEYISLTYETEFEESDSWEVPFFACRYPVSKFKLEDFQRNREVNFEFLEGRTIDHIEINDDNEIVFALREEYDDMIHPCQPKDIFPDNLFEI